MSYLRSKPIPGTTPPSATSPQNNLSSSTKSRSRRHVTQTACVPCRNKRTKCDGRTPCSRCIERNMKCEYTAKATKTKHELRAELRTLESERESDRIVLQALLLDKHEAVVTRLRSGESIKSIARDLREGGMASQEKAEEPSSILERDQGLDHSDLLLETGDSTEPDIAFVDVAEQFQAGKIAPVYTDPDRGDAAATKWVYIPEASPSSTVPSRDIRPVVRRRHSFDTMLQASGLISTSSIWTKVTPTMNIPNHLIGLLFTWEFPLFTMVSQDLFLRDYYHGSRAFCSSALVNAMSSLATRYLQPNEVTSAADIDLLGDTFFRESMGLLVRESRASPLTSVQAFGLLAMRELACGRELEAQEICLQAVRLLGSLDVADFGAGQHTDYATVVSTTCSGVLTLTRALRLITEQLSPSSNFHQAKIPLVSEPSAPHGESVVREFEKRMDKLRDDGSSQPNPTDSQTVNKFVFEQTEYVYGFLAQRNKLGKTEMRQQLPSTFHKCLMSYDTVLASVRLETQPSPHFIFAHTFFQFCLLVLCRPFAEDQCELRGLSPRTICIEAVQTILDLTDSFASLFTLRRTSCFIPYFVFAAGATRIVFHADDRTSNTGATTPEMGLSPETDTPSPGSSVPSEVMSMGGNDVGQFSQPSSSRTANNSTRQSSLPDDDRSLTQPIKQLEAMSLGNRAVSQAGWILRDFKPDST